MSAIEGTSFFQGVIPVNGNGCITSNGVGWAIPGATVDWQSLPGNLLPPGFSLTRASDGTYFDSAGLLQTAATDVARGTYRYNGSAWVFDGTMIEAAATNLRLRSNALSTAPWDVTNIDGIVQNVTGPLGANTAWTLTDSNAGAYRYIQAVFSSVVSIGVTYTDWILIGKTSGTPSNFPGIEIQFGVSAPAIVQTTTGVITALNGNATWAIYDYSQDFWLVAATYVAGLTTSNIVLFPALSSNGTTASTAATGSAVFSLATTEAGSYPTSYIATGAASATRNADVVTAPTSGLLVNAQGFAAMGYRTIASGTTAAQLSTWTGSGSMLVTTNATTAFVYNGVNIGQVACTPQVAGEVEKIASTWVAGSYLQIAANGTVGTQAALAGNMNLGSTIRIGNHVSGASEPISMVLQSMRLGVISLTAGGLSAVTQ